MISLREISAKDNSNTPTVSLRTLADRYKIPAPISLTALKSAIDTNVELWFSGFRCLDESNEPSASDEPYMFLGVSTTGQAQTPHATGTIEVDRGDVIRTSVRLYSGQAKDVILAVVICEEDFGEAWKTFHPIFKGILEAGNKALQSKTSVGIPPGLVDGISKELSKELSSVFGLGDDDVGRRTDLLTRDFLIQMANRSEGGDPVSDFTWDLGSDSEGIYRLYFFVRKI